MEAVRTIINCMLIPVISVYVYFFHKKYEMKFGLRMLAVYALAVALNIFFTRVACNAITFFTGQYYDVTASWYTLVAAVMALLMVYILEAAPRLLKYAIMDNEE